MSHSQGASASSSNFQPIFNNALKAYEKRTKKDLLAHPLAAQLQGCNSSSDILAVLQQQVQGIGHSRNSDDRWTKWLDPTVNVLYAFSATLGEDVGLASSPVKVIFTGVVVLISAANDVRGSQETLLDFFERIEGCFRRLEVYTRVPPTTEMMDTHIQIMVEVISILGIATKEIKQGRMEKYGKRLIGRTEMEDALNRLDKLTQEEARVAATPAKHFMEQIANDVDQVKQNQLRENIYRWLSPPDPSTNHNIACGTHFKRTAAWFFQGSTFREWKSNGSLLWIHGKPGSGKSVLCSMIIQDIQSLCEAGEASMAYFYFDFRDASKQHLRNLVSSLLTQLSAHSSVRRDLLSELYSVHGSGEQQPTGRVLTNLLKDMLTLPDQRPIYLIMDALDESPDTGIPSPRETVLHLLNELVELWLPNLHICVTSRPEFDIREVISPLTSLRVALHDQSGQKEDIAYYVRSVIYSNSEPIIRRWRKEDKEFVIKVLSERADGMFRWVFCQLEVLRHCLPSSVRRYLEELPESLDETYERMLREIKKPNRDQAQRLLHCLVGAIQPLGVEELAEVLAVDFNDAEGIPKLKPSWRWENQEQAILTSCSSLIAIVGTGRSRVVQFSHFSVREFLTSARLAASRQDISRYHVALEPAHTILAQACVSVLLQLHDRVEQDNVGKNSPLAQYAAENWVRHAQFEDVVSRVKGMEYLFDPDKPYFAAWCQLHDIDTHPSEPSVFFEFTPILKSSANTPLYYAALCGFSNLVEQLVVKYPQHVGAIGGYYGTPAVAALAGRHFQLAQALHHNGSSVDPRGHSGKSPLHSAAYCEDLEMVRALLDCGANVNAKDDFGFTPLDFASLGHFSDPSVVRLLLDHGADPNVQAQHGITPLYRAAKYGRIEIARLLAERSASIEVQDEQSRTLRSSAAGL